MTAYLPSREADLVTWSTSFNSQINATPANIGLTALQATAYGVLHAAWVSTYNAANNNLTRTPGSIEAKNVAKENLIDGANGIRQLVNIIQAFPGTTDQERIDLGITVRDTEPTAAPQPEHPPVLVVTSTVGRVINLRLKDFENAENRGRPEGVAGATILIHVGEEAPLDPMQWVFLLNTTQTSVSLDMPFTIEAGARVWLTAFWRNSRDEASTAAVPVSARLGDTLAQVG